VTSRVARATSADMASSILRASFSTASAKRIRVGFVGSGAVNFGAWVAGWGIVFVLLGCMCPHPTGPRVCWCTGGAEGPWDHASRLEALAAKFGVEFVGVADPLKDKARSVIDGRRAGKFGSLYNGCEVYGSHQELLEKARPDAVRAAW